MTTYQYVNNPTHHHQEILRLAACGMRNFEIARALNITPVTVKNVLANPLAQRTLSVLSERRDESVAEIKQRLEAASCRAMGIVENVLAGESAVSPRDQLQAAFSVLDRVGYGAAKRIDITQKNEYLADPDMLDRINEIAKTKSNTQKVVEEIYDAEFTEEA
jgi:hypothetical protein